MAIEEKELEDQGNEKIEKDGQAEGLMQKQENEIKRDLQRKAKNKVMKVVWNAIKVAVIPMLFSLVKIFASILGVILIVTMITSAIDEERFKWRN